MMNFFCECGGKFQFSGENGTLFLRAETGANIMEMKIESLTGVQKLKTFIIIMVVLEIKNFLEK